MAAHPAHEPQSGLPEGLSERDARILEFERQWWRHAGAKEEAIRSEFSLSAARYYQVLNEVIDSPHAVRHDPMLVRRLLRARDDRTRARAERTFTISDRGSYDAHIPDKPRSE
jgi:hypothetical protein